MSCGHTTCTGFTAVRRSQIGQPEVSTTHRNGDEPGNFFPGLDTSPRSAKASTTWSTAVRAIPCLRAAGGDRSKDYNINFMVDYRPRDSLTEGRGW
jgi:hypothetical protein